MRRIIAVNHSVDWPFYLAGNYKIVWERYNGGQKTRLQNPNLEEPMEATLGSWRLRRSWFA